MAWRLTIGIYIFHFFLDNSGSLTYLFTFFCKVIRNEGWRGLTANLSLPCLELLLDGWLTKGSLWFLMLAVDHGSKGEKLGNHHHHTFGEGRGLHLRGLCGSGGFSIMPSRVNHERGFHHEASARVTCMHSECTSQPHMIFMHWL